MSVIPPEPEVLVQMGNSSPTTRAKQLALVQQQRSERLATQPPDAATTAGVTATVPADAGQAVAAVPAVPTKGERVHSHKGPHINVKDEKAHAALIQLIGCVLSQLVAFEEQSHPNGRGSLTMFHTAYVPAIRYESSALLHFLAVHKTARFSLLACLLCLTWSFLLLLFSQHRFVPSPRGSVQQGLV